MKKILILCAITVIIFLLTACGEITDQREERWQVASLELQQLEKILDEKVKVASEYYNAIDDEIKKEMSPIDFTLYKVESAEVSKPEKEKEFDTYYNKLQKEIEKISKTIKSVPTIEEITEEEQTIIKQHEEKRKQEEQKKIKEREKQQETQTEERNEGNSISPNQKANESKRIYTRYAEMGAVITDSPISESKMYRYKRKCDSCGYIPTITYSGSSSLSSAFTCQKCKNHQKIKIKQEMTWQ